MPGLFDELKRRRVFRVMAGYAIAAWVVLQVAEVTFEPLHLPDWALTAVVVVVIAGFPVAFVLAWVFQLTPQGVRRDAGPIGGGEHTPLAFAAPARASVAVLAFDDMSPERDQRYLCDGIAAEIHNRLTRAGGLRVASRKSSFGFRDEAADVATIGRKLNVQAVLEGSVRKSGNLLRVATQLVNADDGYNLWSDSFERELCDVFEIQDEIAACVADALQVTLTCPKGMSTTTDTRAYEYYLRGQSYFDRWGLRNMRFAIEMFERAVDADADYARAWASLADCHAMVCMYWNTSPDSLQAAESASRRALELAPDIAEPHVSRGLAHFIHGRHDEAGREFDAALQLAPDSYAAAYFYARVRFSLGDAQSAATLFERAEAARSDDFQVPALLRQVYHALARHRDAREAAKRSIDRIERHLELFPDDSRALNLGLGSLAELGRRDQLLEWAERSLALDGDNPDTLYNAACGYALIEEIDKAFDCLERASLCGLAIAGWAEHDTDLIALHDDPRFERLIERMHNRCAT